jgi:hypothetical protein
MLAEELRAPADAPTTGKNRVGVCVGGVSVAIHGHCLEDVQLSPELRMFRAEQRDADMEISVQWVQELMPWRGEKVFDSAAVWKLFREPSELIFDFSSPGIGAHPYKRLQVDENFRIAQLTLSREALERHRPIYPLEYPADELLITNYLATGLGVEVHGCGLVDAETGGHLLLGHSGAGKSTTTRLWKSLRNPRILSDDRIILRLHDGELWMYGTPWHGEAAFALPGKSRVRRIFILEHGDHNQITQMTRSQAVGELFARSFPPFHNANALERTVGFLDRILDRVRCYRFQFVPDARAVDAVVEFHD